MADGPWGGPVKQGAYFSVKCLGLPVSTRFDPLRTAPVVHQQPENSPVKTPCIGICSTTSFGDSICRGCKRFSTEVIDWNSYSNDEKRAVLQRISKLVVQIMEPRFAIHSVDELRRGMKAQGVPVNPDLPPYCWLHNLLKKRHRQIDDLTRFGASIRSDDADVLLRDLWEQADAELLALCDAHRLRYFPALV